MLVGDDELASRVLNNILASQNCDGSFFGPTTEELASGPTPRGDVELEDRRMEAMREMDQTAEMVVWLSLIAAHRTASQRCTLSHRRARAGRAWWTNEPRHGRLLEPKNGVNPKPTPQKNPMKISRPISPSPNLALGRSANRTCPARTNKTAHPILPHHVDPRAHSRELCESSHPQRTHIHR